LKVLAPPPRRLEPIAEIMGPPDQPGG